MSKQAKVRRSLVYSFWDGWFASIQFGIIEQFSTPLALFFGADSAAVGLLNFVRGSLVSIIQVVSSNLTIRLKSRKKLITTAVFWGALLWLPTFFLPIYAGENRVLVFLLLFSLAASINMLPTPAWSSLMSEYIPPSKRGRYFGWRGAALGFVYSGAVIFAGLLLHFSRNIFWGFAILMIVAAVARLISWFFLTKMYEPPWRNRESDYFSFWDFIKQLKRSNFARFALLSALFICGVNISSPFIAIYLLQELRFDYFTYTLLILAAVVMTYAAQQYWGRAGDRYGNMKVIRGTGLLVALVPVLWFLNDSFGYLFLVQLFAGSVWAGYNLATANFIFDVAMPAKRERCISYFNFLSGIGLGVGALLGGWLYRILPPIGGSSFFLLLGISTAARLLALLAIVVFTREVKKMIY